MAGLFDDIPTAASTAPPADASAASAPDTYTDDQGRVHIVVRPRSAAPAPTPPDAQETPAQTPVQGVTPAARDLLIRTVIGEAGNQPDIGQSAVAHVVLNRLNAGNFGRDIPNVVLAPYQFEPWQTRSSQLMALSPSSPTYQKAAAIVDSALAGDQDPTGGATHFLQEDIVRARRGGSLPDWAQGQGLKIGDHTFFLPGGKLNPPAPDAAAPAISSSTTAASPVASQVTPPAAAPAATPAAGPGGLFDDIPAPGAPKSTAAQALARGAAQGLSANFADEIYGAGQASGLPSAIKDAPFIGGIAPPVGVARLLWEKLISGPGSATRAYQEGRDHVRRLATQAQQDHPGAFGTGEVAGTIGSVLAAPEVTVARGAGLGARAANAAANGGLYGAVSGAGEGDGAADTAVRAATGLAVGSTIGAALTPVAEAAGQVASRALGGLTRNARDAAAARQVVASLGGPTAASRAADVVERSNAGGVPLAVADTGGVATQRLADQASINSPAANQSFQNLFEARGATQKDRLVDAVRNIVGGDFDSTLAREQLQTAARQQNKPAYARAYAAGDRPIWSAELERLSASPTVLNAMRGAQSTWKDWQVVDGFGAANPPVKIANGGMLKFLPGKGLLTHPDIQFWDYTARILSDQAQAARDAGKMQAAARIGGLERQLKAELDKAVPEFGAARTGAARFFGAQDAMEAGENFVGASTQNTEARQALAKMTPAERQLFANGFASTLIKSIREVSDRQSVTNKAFINNPAARERIGIALGEDGARRIEAFLRLERMMQSTRDAVSGNSKTAQRFVDAGLLGGGLGYDLHNGDFSPDSIGTMAVVGALTKAGRRSINAKVAQRVGELLSSQDPNALRSALDLAARNPGLLDAIRRADSFLPRVISGTLKPNVGNALMPVAANANDGKQQ